jgi:outer membrane receptor protein involved in Fe transport
MTKPSLRLFSFAIIAAALAASGAAQTVTGTLQGTATDTSGGVLPGVTVVVRGTDTGLERTLVTNEKGFYNAPFLPIGRYQVRASLPGFGTVLRDKVDVRLNDTQVVDFTLGPQVAEIVTVTAERPSINTTNAEIKQSLTAEQILDKPTLSQTNAFLSLAETFAGFQENPTSGQNNPTASSGSSINFDGTGTRGATFQINGVNNDDASENQNRQGVSISTIQEFQVISNTYSAEFGRGYGAVVLVQTKQGTNRVTGDVYGYFQDSQWNSKSFFARTKPDNHRRQYGGTVGFPMMKNRLFGYLSFDQTREAGTLTYARDLFLPAELSRPRLTRGNDTPANRQFIDSILARFPSALAPNDPRSPRTFQGVVGFDRPVNDYTGRMDWDPTSSDHITGRAQYTRQVFDNEDIIVGETTKQNNRQINYGVTWTHLFSTSTVGELRYGLGIRDTNVDVKAGNDTPIMRFLGTPVASATIGSAGNFPIHRDQTDNQIVYNVSSVLGATHNLKAGGDVRFSSLDDLADNFSRGFWNLSATCGGVNYPTSYAAFLDGCASTFQRGYGNFFLENRLKEYNFYGEDNWKVRPNLTLDLGVRYEYVGAAKEKEGRLDYVYGADRDNVEPRVGFAWSPDWSRGLLGRIAGGAGNSSIRGGYGIYHGRVFQSVFSQGGANVRFNPPNAIFLPFNNSLNMADPTNGFVFTPGPQTARHAEALISPDLEMPSTHKWNLTFERKLPWNSSMRLTYAGTRGMGLLRYTQDNLPVSPLAGSIVVVNHPNNAPLPGFPDLRGIRIDKVADDFQCAGTGFLPGITPNATCPVPVPLANNEISVRVPRTNERRPDPRFTTNLVVSNGANSWYHGLQVEWLKRLTSGLRFELAYTWSKAIDDTSEATFVGAGDSNILGPNQSFSRGLSRFDTRHRFTLNGTWLLPIFRDRHDFVGKAFGGWQLAAVLKLSSGTPFTVVDTAAGGDINFDGFSENRPVVLDPSILYRTVDDVDHSVEQLPRSAFRRATFRDVGGELVGRNTFFGDRLRTLNLGIYKSFATTGNQRLSVRLELYNAFNRTQFGFPSADLAATNFGQIVGTNNAYNPRTVQLTLRYLF